LIACFLLTDDTFLDAGQEAFYRFYSL